LKLSAEQATRLARLPLEARTAHREETLKLRDQSLELQKARAAVEARQEAEMAKAMTDVLTPEQRQRLEQIKVQVLGPGAWDDPAVRKALKLTDEQKAAINKARDEARAAVRGQRTAAPRPAPVRSGPASPKELRLYERQLAAGYRALQDRIVALLTPEQQKRWRELTGPPVRFRVERDPFGGGRSGGRGRTGP
jgi:Spy/CpxP family protein refolding chaperone